MFKALTRDNFIDIYTRFVESTDPNETEFVGITHDPKVARFFDALRFPAKESRIMVDVDEWLEWFGDMASMEYFDEHPEDYEPRWVITAYKEWDPEDELQHDIDVEYYDPFRVFG